MDEMGLIHIYYGDGKGKTTCATGLALRCAGGGGKVLFFQFLKDGSSGEIDALKAVPGIEVMEGYKETKFSFQMTELEKKKTKEYYQSLWKKIVEKVYKEDYQLLVLDECLHAINLEYIDLGEVLDFLYKRPQGVEIVLTGRNPKEELIQVADYVTEMKKIKHPFDLGIGARRLIEH